MSKQGGNFKTRISPTKQLRLALRGRDQRIIRRFELRRKNGQLKQSNCRQVQTLLQQRKADNRG